MTRKIAFVLVAISVVVAIAFVVGEFAWKAAVRTARRDYHVELTGHHPVWLFSRLSVSGVTVRYPVSGAVVEAAASRLMTDLVPWSLFSGVSFERVSLDRSVVDIVIGERHRPVLDARLVDDEASGGTATFSRMPGADEFTMTNTAIRFRDTNGAVMMWWRDVNARVTFTLGPVVANGTFHSGPVRSSILDAMAVTDGSLQMSGATLHGHGILAVTKRSSLQTDLSVHFSGPVRYELSATAKQIDLLDVLNATLAGERKNTDFAVWPEHQPANADLPASFELALKGNSPLDTLGGGVIALPGGMLPDLDVVQGLSEALGVHTQQKYEKTRVIFTVENMGLTIQPFVIRNGTAEICVGGRIAHPVTGGRLESELWTLVRVDRAVARALKMSPDMVALLSDDAGRLILPFVVSPGWSGVKLNLVPDAIELALEGNLRAARHTLFFGAADKCVEAGKAH